VWSPPGLKKPKPCRLLPSPVDCGDDKEDEGEKSFTQEVNIIAIVLPFLFVFSTGSIINGALSQGHTTI
jgi:hypothetical protein